MRYVGDAVAAVVAETVAAAKDAAEAVVVDIDPLPAVTEPRRADAPDAPLLYDDVPGNVGLDFHFGDSDKVAAAFAAAAHVTRLRAAQQPHRRQRDGAALRRSRNTIPSAQHWTLHVGCQGVFGFRNYIAQVLGVGRDKVRVLTDRVGGSFGMKQPTYAEYYCILHAARELGRPVKWTDERSGSFVSDSHGRDHEMTAELALDRDGNFLAVRLTGYGNLGATYGAPGPATAQRRQEHARRLQDAADRGEHQMRLHQHDAGRRLSRRRAAGGQLLHGAAGRYRRGRDRASTASSCAGATTSRPRRCRTRARTARPMTAAISPPCSNKALALADWDGFAARQAESRARGKLRGRGIGDYLELTGPPGREMGGIRFEPNGDVTIDHRHARLRPGPLRRRSPRCWRRGSASRSAASACCRATATS